VQSTIISEFPKYVLPLPCNICINMTSWDGLIKVQITAAVGQSHPSTCLCQSERRILWTQSYPFL